MARPRHDGTARAAVDRRAPLLRLLQLAQPGAAGRRVRYSQGLEPAVDAGWVTRRGDGAATGSPACCTLGLARWTCRCWRSASTRLARGDDARASQRWNDWLRATPRDRASCAPRTEQLGALARAVAAPARRADARLRRARGAARRRRPSRSPSRSPRPPRDAPRARRRCSPSPSAGPRTWCRPRVKAVPLGQSAGQRILAALARRDPRRRRRARSRARRRRSPGLRARCWPSCRRGTKPSTRACSDPEPMSPCTTSPTAPRRCRRCASASAGPSARARPRWSRRCARRMRDRYDIAVVTNDIYTKEDQQFLTRSGALPAERIVGVETGGCPHTAIREDASINLEAVDRMLRDVSRCRHRHHRERRRQPGRHLQPRAGRPDDLRDRRRRRRQDPAQGRPRHHQERPAGHQQDRPRAARRRLPRRDGRRRARMRGDQPFVFTNLKTQRRPGRGRRVHRAARAAEKLTPRRFSGRERAPAPRAVAPAPRASA